IIIATDEQNIPENLQTSLEKAINKVKESKILKEVINDLKELSEISDNQEVKKYFQEINNLNILMKNLDLESTFSNEIYWLIDEIDKQLKSLPKWNDCCAEITNQFEDLNNFANNIKDSLFFFEIQEILLTKLDEVREKL
ncbi:27990_t:CDS:2, partial [Gigaspora margarita]